ncbi:flagellar protein FlaG [Paenibacillus chibensis]|uniref:flagellar protein FlaG n=1 Tax=Paenibacillus chibensis TaxID=59846 RepID=UPI001FE4FC24|nr:flagellar protein FlaG [Paenibacillus chibensis]MEC0370804.1 flagellar protein FlaG [Paenibacillus chibensis]
MNIGRVDRVTPEVSIKKSIEDISSLTESSSKLAGDLQNKTFSFQNLSEEEKKKLDEQLKKLNESISSTGKQLHFKYNDEAKQLYVEVVNSKTQEVISSLPPEFLIDLSIKMKEMIGMFLDKKV